MRFRLLTYVFASYLLNFSWNFKNGDIQKLNACCFLLWKNYFHTYYVCWDTPNFDYLFLMHSVNVSQKLHAYFILEYILDNMMVD